MSPFAHAVSVGYVKANYNSNSPVVFLLSGTKSRSNTRLAILVLFSITVSLVLVGVGLLPETNAILGILFAIFLGIWYSIQSRTDVRNVRKSRAYHLTARGMIMFIFGGVAYLLILGAANRLRLFLWTGLTADVVALAGFVIGPVIGNAFWKWRRLDKKLDEQLGKYAGGA